MKYLKIGIMVCLAMLAVVLSFPALAYSDSNGELIEHTEVQVYFNQKRIHFLTAPLIVEGRVVIPVRSFLELMGSEVQWNEETMQVIARYKDSTITIYLEESFAEINGTYIEMNPSVTVVQGSTMVPLRFITECLGLNLDWNEEDRVASITSRQFVPYKRFFPGFMDSVPHQIEAWAEQRRDELGVDVNVFDNQLFILATFGLKESGGYDVQVLNIERQEKSSFQVEIEYVQPEAGQYTFPAFTRPYDLVLIDLEQHDLPASIQFNYRGNIVDLYRQLPDQLLPQ